MAFLHEGHPLPGGFTWGPSLPAGGPGQPPPRNKALTKRVLQGTWRGLHGGTQTTQEAGPRLSAQGVTPKRGPCFRWKSFWKEQTGKLTADQGPGGQPAELGRPKGFSAFLLAAGKIPSPHLSPQDGLRLSSYRHGGSSRAICGGGQDDGQEAGPRTPKPPPGERDLPRPQQRKVTWWFNTSDS